MVRDGLTPAFTVVHYLFHIDTLSYFSCLIFTGEVVCIDEDSSSHDLAIFISTPKGGIQVSCRDTSVFVTSRGIGSNSPECNLHEDRDIVLFIAVCLAV